MTFILLQNCDGFWAWPWPLILAFLLGLLLGWLLSKIFGNKKDNDDSKYEGLQAELEACRENNRLLKNQKIKTNSSFVATPKENNSLQIASKIDDSIKDDLTKVEGIGPKIKGLLNDDGIWSFVQLSESSIERLQKILEDAGPRYRMHKPKTWAQQAGLAAKGEWDKLKKWQDELKGGL